MLRNGWLGPRRTIEDDSPTTQGHDDGLVRYLEATYARG